MNFRWNKVLSVLLAVVMVVGLVPANAFFIQTNAVETSSEEPTQKTETTIEHNNPGENVACILNADGACGQHYATLQAAINEVNDGETIMLLSDSAESVEVKAKSKEITIDGNDKTYTGMIYLSEGNGKSLTIQNAKLSPANAFTVSAAKGSNWHVIVDNCTITSQTDKWSTASSYAIVYGTQTDNLSVTIKNCSKISGLYYIAAFSQGGKSLTIENCQDITDCVYLVSAGKCNAVTVKNVTYTGESGILMKGEGNPKTLTIENANINVLYNGQLPINVSNNPTNVSVTIDGTNRFTYNDVAFEGTTWISSAVPAEKIEGEENVNPAPAYVAQIGEQGYETLQAAMEEANKAAGTYTITLLSDIAESFSFAQNAGVNITIDGEGKSFTGTITLNAGAGELKFTDMVVMPPVGTSTCAVKLNASTAPNVTFDDCVLTYSATPDYTSIVLGSASTTSNKVVFQNCSASKLTYLYTTNQAGANEVVVDNCEATNMVYLLRPMKTPNVTVKDVTYSGQTFIQVKNSNEGTLHIEDVTVTTTLTSMPPITMLAPDSGNASVMYTIELKGTRIANGVAMTVNNEEAWFACEKSSLLYEIIDQDFKPVVSVDGVMYGTWDAAKSAIKNNSEIKLYADIEINSGYMFAQNNTYYIDLNGKHLSVTSGTSVTMYFNTKLYITDSVGGGKITGSWIMSDNTTFKVPANAEFEGRLQINANGKGHFYIGDTCWIGYGNDDAVFYTDNATERVHFKNGYLSLDQEYGNLILMKDLSTLPMQQITIRVGTTLTVSENVTLTLDATTELIIKGTFISKGTVVVNSAEHLKQIMETNKLVNESETPKPNNKIVLGSDIDEVNELVVYSNVTLDLKGHYLESAYVVSYGAIIDSTEGKGGIITTKDGLIADKNNSYLPLYDADNGCFRFFKYQLALLKCEGGENSVTYRFRLKLSTKEAYLLLADTDNSGVKINMSLNVTMGEETIPLEFSLGSDLLKEYAKLAYEQVDSGKKEAMSVTTYFYLTLYGVDKLGAGTILDATPAVFSSYTGVTMSKFNEAATSYTVPTKEVTAKPEDEDTTETEEEKTV